MLRLVFAHDQALEANHHIVRLLKGPMDVTIEDFWKMTWQCKVQTIAMLTNLEENGE
jgi:protein tyrosine phosphatase